MAGGAGAGGSGLSVMGKVVSVGENVKGIKKGDVVLINGFLGMEVEFEDGEKGKFINVVDVLAVFG